MRARLGGGAVGDEPEGTAGLVFEPQGRIGGKRLDLGEDEIGAGRPGLDRERLAGQTDDLGEVARAEKVGQREAGVRREGG